MNRHIILLMFYCIGFVKCLQAEQKTFIIVTASYNNKEWYKKNLDSIFSQTYENWRLIYIDDCSTDDTGKLVKKYLKDKGMSDRVKCICNETRKGHLSNQYAAIHSAKPYEVIVNLDGDDWFAHNNVLSLLNEVYQDPNIWLTYGQFAYSVSKKIGFCKPIPKEIILKNEVRTLDFVFSHPRTFYAGLFQRIKFEDLLYENEFYPMGVDLATMYPMLEMAGHRIKFIPEVLYIYNNSNPINFLKQKEHIVNIRKIQNHIRSKKKYEPLKTALFIR